MTVFVVLSAVAATEIYYRRAGFIIYCQYKVIIVYNKFHFYEIYMAYFVIIADFSKY